MSDPCHACGAPLEAGARFCPLCGHPSGPGGFVATTPALPSGNDAETLESVKGIGWNWGGFFVPYFWLLGHGRVSLGFILLASTTIPLINVVHLVLYPVTAVYLGLQGYEISWRHRAYHSVEQLLDGEREWALWGALFLVLFVGALLLTMLYMRGAMSEIWHGMESAGG